MLRRLSCLILTAAFLITSAPASAKPSTHGSEAALSAAKAQWQALKADPRRSRYRSHWLKVADRFAAVARRYPRTPQAPKALFDAAELFEDLSRISWIQDDVDSAIQAYARLCNQYPGSSLADDARLALARIYLDRKGDARMGRVELERLLARYPRGDMARQARAMLAGLPKEPHGVAASAAAAGAVSAPRPAAGEGEPPPPLKAPYPTGEEPPPPATATAVKPDRDRIEALSEAVKGGDVPLSAQMGLKVRRVVIDAGHGGHDTGAVGPHGLKEKDVTLVVAKKLADKLRAQGLEVLLTRTDDTFVPLEERTAFANRSRADLFISVHCNAATHRSWRGVSTYSLNVSSDRYAVRLAARENASSEKSISDLQLILADLATKANTADSVRLGGMVQRSVVQGLRQRYDPVRDLGTRQALFYVLLGTRMPAILVETSFISNPTEEHRLNDAAYQDQLAQAISEGVERFIGDREEVASLPGMVQ